MPPPLYTLGRYPSWYTSPYTPWVGTPPVYTPCTYPLHVHLRTPNGRCYMQF